MGTLKRRNRGNKRSRRTGRTGFCCSIALTAGILGMAVSQTIVWAAPKSEKSIEKSDMLIAEQAAELQAGQEAEEISSLMQGKESEAGRQSSMQNKVEKEETEEVESPLIAIDPGHGGVDCGCVGKKVEEKDVNLQIALELEKKLTEKGYRVLVLREKDEFQGLMDRVEIANSYQADVYVSIHQNTYEGKDKTVGGIETWYDGTDTARDNQRLALLVHRETVKSTGARGRGVIDSTDLYVASKTLMPACLIETGFLSNPQEEKLLSSADYQKKLAEGIARGIELYFHPGIMYVPFEEAPWKLTA